MDGRERRMSFITDSAWAKTETRKIKVDDPNGEKSKITGRIKKVEVDNEEISINKLTIEGNILVVSKEFTDIQIFGKIEKLK